MRLHFLLLKPSKNYIWAVWTHRLENDIIVISFNEFMFSPLWVWPGFLSSIITCKVLSVSCSSFIMYADAFQVFYRVSVWSSVAMHFPILLYFLVSQCVALSWHNNDRRRNFREQQEKTKRVRKMEGGGEENKIQRLQVQWYREKCWK